MAKVFEKMSLNYASHLSALIKAVLATDGDVLELGMGFFSTPVLHHLCILGKRKLVSYDNIDKYVIWARYYGYEGKYHKIHYVDNWDKAKIEKPWDVVLVDHSPNERRIIEIRRLAKYAKYIVIHDAERKKDREYHYSEIYPLFKYKSIWEEDRTAVLSNFVDLTDFKKK